jgi:serine/threonine-protein kinase RsbW
MSTVAWIWQCDRVIPSSPGAGRGVIEELLQELQTHQWAQRDVFAVHLAMEEALTNAIKHGNRHDANKQVQVSCRVSPDLVHIEIADEGPGFNPNGLPNPTEACHLAYPNGRGVMLMRGFMSRVSFNAVGNRVMMEKDRGPGHG